MSVMAKPINAEIAEHAESDFVFLRVLRGLCV